VCRWSTRAERASPSETLGTGDCYSTRIGAPGASPLITASALPAFVDLMAFEVNGANVRVVGTSSISSSLLRFDVFDADGTLLGSFGRPTEDTPR